MRPTILFTTVLATSILASPHPNVEVVQIRQVERRQDSSSIDLDDLIPSACMPPTEIASIPTPPSAVLSALASITNTDPCYIPSFTGSIGSQYVSYTSALSSWYTVNSAKVESWESVYVTACPLASSLGLTSLLPSNTDLSSLASCRATGTAKSSGSTVVTVKSSSAAAASTGAAPQQTALAAAAGMLAGIAGVIAAL